MLQTSQSQRLDWNFVHKGLKSNEAEVSQDFNDWTHVPWERCVCVSLGVCVCVIASPGSAKVKHFVSVLLGQATNEADRKFSPLYSSFLHHLPCFICPYPAAEQTNFTFLSALLALESHLPIVNFYIFSVFLQPQMHISLVNATSDGFLNLPNP